MRILSLTNILLEIESDASKQAHKLGLEFAGWGKWKDKSGKVVAKTVDGKLVGIDKEKKEPKYIKLKGKELQKAKKSAFKFFKTPIKKYVFNKSGKLVLKKSEDLDYSKRMIKKLGIKDNKSKEYVKEVFNEKQNVKMFKKLIKNNTAYTDGYKLSQVKEPITLWQTGSTFTRAILNPTEVDNSKLKKLKIIDDLSSKSNINWNQPIYRGMNFYNRSVYNQFKKNYQKGTKVSIPASGFTIHKSIAGRFSIESPYSIMYVINSKDDKHKGIICNKFGDVYKDEAEIIRSSKEKLKVKNVKEMIIKGKEKSIHLIIEFDQV